MIAPSNMTCSPARNLTLGLLLVLLTGNLPKLQAQREIFGEARFAKPEVAPGEAVAFTVSIRGLRNTAPTPHVSASGLEFRYRDTFVSTKTDPNFGAVRELLWLYEATATVPGTYEVPAVEIATNEGTFKTNPAKLTVVATAPERPASAAVAAPRSSTEPFLQLRLGKRELFVGEVVPLQLILYSSYRTQLSNPDPPRIQQEGFTFRRFASRYERGDATLSGRRYRTNTFRSQFSAIQPGQTPLGPASIRLDVVTPEARSRARVNLESPRVNVTVKPLPTEGQPKEFGGVVGQFILTSKISAPEDLRVGDPINVILTVAGQGNFGAIEAPALATKDGWQLFDSQVYEEPDRLALGTNRVSFSQVIVPEETHREIPPFQFTFFNPETENYITLKSEPTPIALLPRRIDASNDVDASGGALPALTETRSPTVEMTDVLHILGKAQWDRTPARPLHRRKLFLACFFGATLALFLVFLAPLIRTLQQRRIAGQNNLPNHRTQLRSLHKQASTLSPLEFLEKARSCLRDSPGTPRQDLMEEIESQYAQARFGQGVADKSPELAQNERDWILSEIASSFHETRRARW